MIIPIIAALAGAIAMGRTKPKTKGLKKVALGPKSGVTYEIEDFAEASFVVVRAPDGSMAVLGKKLEQSPDGHVRTVFSWHSSQGAPPTLHGIARDFLPDGAIKNPAPVPPTPGGFTP